MNQQSVIPFSSIVNLTSSLSDPRLPLVTEAVMELLVSVSSRTLTLATSSQMAPRAGRL